VRPNTENENDGGLGALLRFIVSPVVRTPTVYPGYIAYRCKQALADAIERPADERVIAAVGEMISLGNSRYAIKATDINGVAYLITVEVAE
jgi:hypothetical protein